MTGKTRLYKLGKTFVLLALATLLIPQLAGAHCDTLDGPVVQAARTALAKGDITPLLKWVRTADEKELNTAFKKTLAVRAKGDEARELADMYFFETLVRIHRAGEGAPYTGLKPGGAVDPAVVLADQSLASGNVDKLVAEMTSALAAGIKSRFDHAREARKHADHNVAAGREFVEAYVVFTHYVEGLHAMITAGAGHHGHATKAGPEATAGGGHEH